MNGARSRTARSIRLAIMEVLGDGRWYTTSELAGGRTTLTEAIYRTLPILERQGLIEVVRGGPRVLVRVVYNPALYTLQEPSDAA